MLGRCYWITNCKKVTKESFIAKQMKESAFYYTAIEQLKRQIDERTKF